MERFFIFAMPRSGTTSLAFLLGTQHEVAHEPFNERSGALRDDRGLRKLLSQWSCLPEQLPSSTPEGQGPQLNRMASLVANEKSCAQYLERLFTHYQGIKHTWPVLSNEGNHRIIDWCKANSICIIFQYRKNIARAVLSARLARQTGIWQMTGQDSTEMRDKWNRAQFESINVQQFNRQCRNWSRQKASHLDRLAGARCFRLAYEHLYEGWTWRRRRTLKRLCKHLSITAGELKPNDVQRLLFNPQKKQSSREVLRRIPNYRELRPFL